MDLMKIVRNNKDHKSYKKFVTRYVRLVLWFFQEPKRTHYLELGNRISNLLKDNGVKYSIDYLKEGHRLIQHFIAGEPTIPQGIRMASRRGLPLIIPGSLRLQMETMDSKCLRIVLTIFTIFRTLKTPGILKLETITDPFTGQSEELHPAEVGGVWRRFSTFLPQIPLSKLAEHCPLVLKTSGPNYRTSILGASLDAIAWNTIATKASRTAFKILSDHSQSKIWMFLQTEIEAVSDFIPKRQVKLGKLSKKLEPAGKIRVFAMADIWTQTVLKPYHEYIFLILKSIPQDGTFDQSAPINALRKKLIDRPQKWVASYDLSAATDRLPIKLQVQVLSQLFNREVGEAWRILLIDRDWYLASKPIRYSVGQPMGALSSWGMLALTHHFIVQVAASRVGKTTWFEDYALLGDDIVIADKAVAESYHSLMTQWLGVSINTSKSLVSETGVMEFAKRIASPTEEFTPLGPKSISGSLRNPAYLPQLFLDYLGKGGDLDWNGVSTLFDQLAKEKDLLRVSKSGLEALTWTVLQPFGFISSPRWTAFKGLDHSGEEGKEYSKELVLRAISVAFAERNEREADRALAKTVDSYKRLRRVMTIWSGLGHPVPPSYRWAVSHAESCIRRMTIDAGKEERIITPFPWTDPLDATIGEVVKYYFDNSQISTPLDNMLARPKVLRPRIKRVNLEFFKRVKKLADFPAILPPLIDPGTDSEWVYHPFLEDPDYLEGLLTDKNVVWV